MSSSEQAIVGRLYCDGLGKSFQNPAGLKKLILFIEVVLEMNGFKDRKTNACNKEKEIEAKNQLHITISKYLSKITGDGSLPPL